MSSVHRPQAHPGRRWVAAVALLAVVAGAGAALSACGRETGTSGADDPGTTGTASPGFNEVAVVTGSNVGGTVNATATEVATDESVDEFLSQFRDDRFATEVREAIIKARGESGRIPLAAVVTLGCETPTSIDVQPATGGWEITAEVPGRDIQCLVAMTSVAVVTVAQ